MKIGIVTPSISREGGGLFDSVRRLSQELFKFDNTVEVFGLVDDHSSADLASWEPASVRLFKCFGSARFNYSPSLRKALLRCDCEVILSQGLWRYISVVIPDWHRKTGGAYIATPHGMLDPWSLKHSGWRKRLAGWLYENRHLKRAACIRALTLTEAQEIRRYGLQNPICVIPNGVDEPPITNPLPKPWSSNPSLDGKQIMLSLGRIHPKKNLVALIHAWRDCLLQPASPLHDWRLVIAGPDELETEKKLKILVAQLSLGSSVHFAGPIYRQQKAAAYLGASGFVIPSLGEGLPIAVLEAWSYGLPALITKECNLSEGINAGAGIEITSDRAGIAAGLQRLATLTNNEHSLMSARAKSLVQRKFNWQQIGREMSDVVLWVTGQGPRPSCIIS